MPPGLHLGSRVRSYCSVCIEVYLAGQRVFIPVLCHSVAQGLSCLANILFPTFAAGDDIYYLRASVAKVTQYPERSMVSGTDDCMRVFHHAACSAADNIAFHVNRWQFSVVQCWWKDTCKVVVQTRSGWSRLSSSHEYVVCCFANGVAH